jgi:hypothetical protein
MNAEGRPLTSNYAHIDLDDQGFKRGLRSPFHVLRFPTVSDEAYARLSDLTASVPRWARGWRWGPGTSNMYRKSILDLVKLGDGAAAYMRSADGHFNNLCHALAGSALIDVPLSGYRIHTANYFTNRENLIGMKKGTRAYEEKSRAETYQSIEVFLQNAEQFGWLLGNNYWPTIEQCTDQSFPDARAYFRTAASVALFLKHAGALRAALGDRRFVKDIVAQLGRKRGEKVLKAGFGGSLPARVHRDLLARRIRQAFKLPHALRRKGR